MSSKSSISSGRSARRRRGRLPAVLALPFLWNVSTEGLQSRYDVKLVKEEPDTLILRIRPRTKAGRSWFSAALVRLDRTTYLPRRYTVVDPDGKTVRYYRATAIRCDEQVSDEALRLPDDVGWEVSRLDESGLSPSGIFQRLLRSVTFDQLP